MYLNFSAKNNFFWIFEFSRQNLICHHFLEIWRWYKTWPLFNGYPTAGGLGNPNAMRKPVKISSKYHTCSSAHSCSDFSFSTIDSFFIIIKPGLSVSICTHTIFFNGNNSVKLKDVLTICFLLIFFLIFSFFGRKNSEKKIKKSRFFFKNCWDNSLGLENYRLQIFLASTIIFLVTKSEKNVTNWKYQFLANT